jgi:FkbM family methyltransferase
MNPTVISLARTIARLTPSSAARLWMLRAYFKSIEGKQTIAARGGITYSLDLSETIDALIQVGAFECDVQHAIEALYQPGTIALDIGANVGAHALPLGKTAGKGGAVYAFEPTSYAFAKLAANIALNPNLNVMAFRVALSDRSQKQVEIDFRSSWRTDGSRADGRCVVDFARLDDWMVENRVNGPISFIKIDVDGNEFPIFIGGRDTLLRDRPDIVMEAVGPHFDSDATNPVLWLWRHGWRFFALKSKKKYETIDEIRCQLPVNDPGMTKSINLIARYER